MTLTLEISPEIERAAAQAQTDVSTFILTAAAKEAATVTQPVSARRAAVNAAFGCARDDSGIDWIADFNENKAADIEAENARDLI